MSVATTEEFLDCVRRSGLVEEDRLAAWLHQAQARGARPDTPQALAQALIQAGLLTAFQTKFLLRGAFKGLVLGGKYKVLDLLGAGGVGRVFLAEHTTLRRRVAIKVLPANLAEVPGTVERFHREARAVAALNHPNILQAFDVDRSGKLHFMVMEYVDGATLQDMVARGGPLDVARACHYIAQAGLGLQHAHEAGIIHRDIKPANIVVDRHGVAKVLDLGLARFFYDQADNLTQQHNEHAVLGTADYMAPEQALSLSQVDGRADIYSLGATFYYLLAGRAPFSQGTAAQKLIWHQTSSPVDVCTLRPDVPRKLGDLLHHMLARSVEHRIQTGLEAATALRAWIPESVPLPTLQEIPHGPAPTHTAGVSSTETPASHAGQPSLTMLPTAAPSSSHGPVSSRRVNDAKPSSPSTPPRRSIPLWKKVVTVTAFGLGLGLGFLVVRLVYPALFFGTQPGDHTPQEQRAENNLHERLLDPGTQARRVLVVSPDANLREQLGARSFATLAQALVAAQASDVVRIVAGTSTDESPGGLFREAIQLGDRLPRNLTIEGFHPSGKRQAVGWYAPGGHKGPLVQINGVGGLRLRGLMFVGEGQVDTLVEVTGFCPGLKLQDLHLDGFKRSGVAVRDGRGEREEPLTIQRTRFKAPPLLKAEAALALEGAGQGVREVRVVDCRFEGPCEAAVRMGERTSWIDLRGNRIYKADAAILWPRAASAALRLSITSNTFCEVQSVLQMPALPPLGGEEGSRILLENNLFAQTAALLRLEEAAENAKVKSLFPTLAGNVREPSSCQEGVFFTEVSPRNFDPLPFDPAQDAEFLRYPPDSPLRKAGFESAPVGAGSVQGN